MRYVIIAILIYIGFLLLRAIIRNLMLSRNSGGKNENQKPKRKYNLDKVQDAEFTEIKNNGSSKTPDH